MTTIHLPERCDRKAAQAVAEELRNAPVDTGITIDANRVCSVGQAMMQVLVSARKTNPATAIEPSESLREIAHVVGLEAVLFPEEDV